MDKQLISKRFSKAIATYPQEANVQRQIADKMIHLLTKHISFPCSKVIEFGCGTGIYSRMLLQALRPEELFLNDLCPEMKYCCEDILRKEQVSFLPGDAEIVPFPTGSTLITSCSALQWFESPENFFKRCNALLNKQGYFAFSTFGKENMKEIRELTGSGLPYRSREELVTALSTHFDILHSEEELISLSFDNPIKVLYHLKQTGVTGVTGTSSQQLRTRRDLQLFSERYTQEFTQGMCVIQTVDKMHVSRTTATGTTSRTSCQLRFRCGGIRSRFFVPHVYPFYFIILPDSLVYFIQTIARYGVNTFYSGFCQSVYQLFCYFLCHICNRFRIDSFDNNRCLQRKVLF